MRAKRALTVPLQPYFGPTDTLKVRKGAFDALNKGSGALGKVKFLEGPTRKPRHASVLARTPTRKRFLHSTVYECLQAFFRHARF